MPVTPAQAHWQRHTALEFSQRHQNVVQTTAWERIYHRFRQDEKRLRTVQSTARKIALKRELLPEYLSWLDGVLEADSGRPDEIFVTCTIWMIDTGDVAGALPLMAYILRHQLPLPDRYRRTPAALMVEEICNPVLNALKVGDPVSLTPALLQQVDALTCDEDMPDQVRAKLYKALGLLLSQSGHNNADALSWLIQATRLNPDAGVKKEIDALRRRLSKDDTGPTDSRTAQTRPG
ncbi:phage terminase small subunit [Escherichia coli]|uniref:phage terminase small subunit n=1 Tax=Escherichia coli TaxID=562 RepID=UPI002879DC58|nr:phage terminase small subunit [Escherichia coli]MDS1619835.1 phage terminase small subunit [Escherichia coli]